MNVYIDPDGRPQYGNARCSDDHPLWLVAEGYAYCYERDFLGEATWWAWKLTAPIRCTSQLRTQGALNTVWIKGALKGGVPAWVATGTDTLSLTLRYIEIDIAQSRGLEGVRHAVAPSYDKWLESVQ